MRYPGACSRTRWGISSLLMLRYIPLQGVPIGQFDSRGWPPGGAAPFAARRAGGTDASTSGGAHPPPSTRCRPPGQGAALKPEDPKTLRPEDPKTLRPEDHKLLAQEA
eukprot:6759375-Pyramimonas_sp.AAC.1